MIDLITITAAVLVILYACLHVDAFKQAHDEIDGEAKKASSELD
jgi:hypothetical protein